MGKFSIFIAGLIVLSGCGKTVDHKGKTPLVEVDHEFLYKEDLQAAMPMGMRGKIASDLPRNISATGYKTCCCIKKRKEIFPIM